MCLKCIGFLHWVRNTPKHASLPLAAECLKPPPPPIILDFLKWDAENSAQQPTPYPSQQKVLPDLVKMRKGFLYPN